MDGRISRGKLVATLVFFWTGLTWAGSTAPPAQDFDGGLDARKVLRQAREALASGPMEGVAVGGAGQRETRDAGAEHGASIRIETLHGDGYFWRLAEPRWGYRGGIWEGLYPGQEAALAFAPDGERDGGSLRLTLALDECSEAQRRARGEECAHLVTVALEEGEARPALVVLPRAFERAQALVRVSSPKREGLPTVVFRLTIVPGRATARETGGDHAR